MAWIIAGAAVVGAIASISSQSSANKSGERQAGLGGQRGQQQQYTPTAQAAQAQQPDPGETPSRFPGARPEAQQATSAEPAKVGEAGQGSSNAINNANALVQTGATLQQTFKGEQDRARAERQAASNANRRAPGPQYQPTADQVQLPGEDTRLQELFGRRY